MIYDWSRGFIFHDEGTLEYTAKEYVPPPLVVTWAYNYSKEQVIDWPGAVAYVPPPVQGWWTNNFSYGQDWIFDIRSAISIGGGVTYYGVLKRWTGLAWIKEPLKTYLAGSWQTKPLYRWDGAEWKLIDTTGV
jgi:hypothetical protein